MPCHRRGIESQALRSVAYTSVSTMVSLSRLKTDPTAIRHVERRSVQQGRMFTTGMETPGITQSLTSSVLPRKRTGVKIGIRRDDI